VITDIHTLNGLQRIGIGDVQSFSMGGHSAVSKGETRTGSTAKWVPYIPLIKRIGLQYTSKKTGLTSARSLMDNPDPSFLLADCVAAPVFIVALQHFS
jgi:hypothetical protein